MTRPAPCINMPEMIARAHLDPNGAHSLEIAVPSGIVGMKFSANQVPQLKRAIEQFEAETIRADGGPDFYNPRTVPLEISR